MGLFKKIKIRGALKEIQDDVDKELIDLNLLKIENNKKYTQEVLKVIVLFGEFKKDY